MPPAPDLMGVTSEPTAPYTVGVAKKIESPDDPMLMEIGRRIRALREAAGMTQVQFHTAAGVSQGYAWRMEAGRQNLSVRSLARVALALGTSMSVILEGIDADPASLGTRDYEWTAGTDVRKKSAGA